MNTTHISTALTSLTICLAGSIAQADSIEWIQTGGTTTPELDAGGYITYRLYATVEAQERLLVVGSGPKSATNETGAVNRLVFSLPVYQHPIGGDLPESQAVQDVFPGLDRDTFCMIGEPDPDVRFAASVTNTWDTGLNGVWYMHPPNLKAVTVVDVDVFGDPQPRVALMQVTVLPGTGVAGDVVLGWAGGGGSSSYNRLVRLAVPDFESAAGSGGTPPTPTPDPDPLPAPPTPAPPAPQPDPAPVPSDESDPSGPGGDTALSPSADTDGDGSVTAFDVANHFDNSAGASRDANGDGRVDREDLEVVLASLGLDPNAHTHKTWKRAAKNFYKTELRDALRSFDKRTRKSAKKVIMRMVTRKR